MTATLTQSATILKVKYPTGELPKAQYKKFPWVASVSKKTDFEGESACSQRCIRERASHVTTASV